MLALHLPPYTLHPLNLPTRATSNLLLLILDHVKLCTQYNIPKGSWTITNCSPRWDIKFDYKRKRHIILSTLPAVKSRLNSSLRRIQPSYLFTTHYAIITDILTQDSAREIVCNPPCLMRIMNPHQPRRTRWELLELGLIAAMRPMP